MSLIDEIDVEKCVFCGKEPVDEADFDANFAEHRIYEMVDDSFRPIDVPSNIVLDQVFKHLGHACTPCCERLRGKGALWDRFRQMDSDVGRGNPTDAE